MAINKRLIKSNDEGGGGAASFNTVTWTGDNISSRDITTVGFEPDMVWIKSRTSTAYHNINDSVRGVNKIIQSNTTFAEQYAPNGGVSSYLSNGFTLEGSSSLEDVNASGVDYVAWCWKAGGPAVTNTDGTITSQVSANTEAGFSIVSYTGNTTANQSYGHGLGIAPAMVITKNIDWSVPDWFVWHKDLSGDDYLLRLNKTNAQQQDATVFSSAPNSNVVNIGQDSGINRNGYRQIAYCFAEVAGFSKFGSYTGNGNDNGPTIECGFEPAFVMIKASSFSGEYWNIYDNKRSPTNERNKVLFANNSNSEDSGNAWQPIDFNATNFQIKANSVYTPTNQNGATYIYMAFANQF